jgi:hypothetical protein
MKKDKSAPKFLEELRKVPVIGLACKQAGITRNTVYRWKEEDPVFAVEMEEALEEGRLHVNDVCEVQLITLAKEKVFPAVKYWLEHHHADYGKARLAKEAKLNSDEIVAELGLVPEDFATDKMEKTTIRITKYLLEEKGLTQLPPRRAS